jgi:hypothetical protein
MLPSVEELEAEEAASEAPPCSVLVAAQEARKNPAAASKSNFFNIIISA